MPDELVVILGAETCLLVFTMTMTLRARRMDVLSGRFFERPVIQQPITSIRRSGSAATRMIYSGL